MENQVKFSNEIKIVKSVEKRIQTTLIKLGEVYFLFKKGFLMIGAN